MALDRNQAGILFKIDVDAMDGAQQIELFKGVVSGASAEIRDQFSRMGNSVQQSFSGATRSITSFGEKLGEASTNQLRGFLGQFGMVGDAASDMIPALSGSSAAMLGLAGASVAAGAALAGAAIQTMDYTGTVDDLAQMTNLTTETIQSLRLAATLSGQSFEETAQTAVIFQKKMEEAKNGNVELAATFSALGVDLNGSVDAAFKKTLESFGRVQDGSAKTAAGLDLFGKGATKLFGVMNQVGGSFDNLTARAKELGIVLDKDAINKANELADRWDILKLKMSGLTLDIGVKVIGWFDNLSDSIAKDVAQLGNLINMIDRFTGNPLSKLRQGLDSMPNQPAPTGSLDMFGRLQALRRPVVPVAPVVPTLDQSGAFSGPGIDPTTGLPYIVIPKTTKTDKTGGGAAKAAKEEKEPRLDKEKIRREYRAYRKALAEEEQKLSDEREKLRVAALDGEEARLRDKVAQMETRLVDARFQAEVAAFEKTDRAGILAQTVANLEAEKALTQKAISEMETARVRAMIRFSEAARANTQKRIADELAAEEKRLDDEAMAYELHLERIDDLRAAADARRQAALEADPSSPLNIFGKAGQDAADKGAGIFGQLGASASGALSTVSQQMGNFGTMMQDVFSGISGGLQNIIQGFIMTGKVGGAAFKQMAASIISAVVAQSAVKAIFELAEGFAASARYDFASAAQHFTAAKFYGVVAGVAAAAAVGMSAIGPGGGGGGDTQFLSESRGGGGSTMREQGSRRNEPQIIIIRAETEPGVMVSKFVQDYRQNGEARGVLRRDLLGEY
jgi:hypothetical protein